MKSVQSKPLLSRLIITWETLQMNLVFLYDFKIQKSTFLYFSTDFWLIRFTGESCTVTCILYNSCKLEGLKKRIFIHKSVWFLTLILVAMTSWTRVFKVLKFDFSLKILSYSCYFALNNQYSRSHYGNYLSGQIFFLNKKFQGLFR